MVADNDSPHAHRLHRQRRFPAWHHHRHLGRGPHAHGAQPRQRQCRRRRFRASRPHLPAGRPRGRRADALRPYGGRRRPLPARRPAAGRRHLRAGQRRRHGDARAAGLGLRRRAWAEAGVGRRPDRLPAAPGNADRAGGKFRHRHSGRRRQGSHLHAALGFHAAPGDRLRRHPRRRGSAGPLAFRRRRARRLRHRATGCARS